MINDKLLLALNRNFQRKWLTFPIWIKLGTHTEREYLDYRVSLLNDPVVETNLLPNSRWIDITNKGLTLTFL